MDILDDIEPIGRDPAAVLQDDVEDSCWTSERFDVSQYTLVFRFALYNVKYLRVCESEMEMRISFCSALCEFLRESPAVIDFSTPRLCGKYDIAKTTVFDCAVGDDSYVEVGIRFNKSKCPQTMRFMLDMWKNFQKKLWRDEYLVNIYIYEPHSSMIFTATKEIDIFKKITVATQFNFYNQLLSVCKYISGNHSTDTYDEFNKALAKFLKRF